MNTVEIKLVKEFSRRPFGRLEKDYGDRSGEAFREKFLVPHLEKGDKVHVILDGYNRYGRSFIDEAFGGLVREHDFEQDFLKEHLEYSHSRLKSVEDLIDERIEVAFSDRRRRLSSQGSS